MEEIKIGSQAPDFYLPASTGNKIGLADYHGKWLVLFFVREFN